MCATPGGLAFTCGRPIEVRPRACRVEKCDNQPPFRPRHAQRFPNHGPRLLNKLERGENDGPGNTLVCDRQRFTQCPAPIDRGCSGQAAAFAEHRPRRFDGNDAEAQGSKVSCDVAGARAHLRDSASRWRRKEAIEGAEFQLIDERANRRGEPLFVSCGERREDILRSASLAIAVGDWGIVTGFFYFEFHQSSVTVAASRPGRMASAKGGKA